MATAALAVADWVAVVVSSKPLEYATKPGVMMGLIAVALAVHPTSSTERWFFVGALALGLLSDVFLMLPRDLFLLGLVAALVEHVAYIAGFRARDFDFLSSVFMFMVASAGGTGSLVALAGALLFFYSDAILAWNRFVKPIRYGRIVNLVPYHLAQVVLVLSLVS
ncbi:MAG: lysoplasmalogenase [Chloroflexi bacterium]|nr:MAG: lysoplasmalogenase [Chloroflexota bacterium]